MNQRPKCPAHVSVRIKMLSAITTPKWRNRKPETILRYRCPIPNCPHCSVIEKENERSKNAKVEALPPGNRWKAGGYRWKPGQSGNPDGGPKTGVYVQACREKLGELVPNDPHKRTFAKLIADMLGHKALLGGLAAAAELADREEGRRRQSVEFNDGHEYPLTALLEEVKKAHALLPPESEEIETAQW
jgi:Family of unknown function (DUF5681)